MTRSSSENRPSSWRALVPLLMLATACGGDGGSGAQGGSDTPIAREIEAAADSLMREMSAYLAGQSALDFSAEWLEEELLETGQKIQIGGTSDVLIQRPGKLRIHLVGDERNQRVVYDGAVFSAYNPDDNVYATIPFEGALDALLDHLAEEYGLVLPLADFVFSSPYESLVPEGSGGTYVGLHSVGGRPSHHLAFMTDNVDWQIWIDAGPRPVPLKIVITYIDWEGSPQFSAELSGWDVSPEVDEEAFTFIPPEGAEQIDFYQAPATEEDPNEQ